MMMSCLLSCPRGGNASTMKQEGAGDLLVSMFVYFWGGILMKNKVLYTMMMSCPLSSRREGNASTVKQVGGCDLLVSICMFIK